MLIPVYWTVFNCVCCVLIELWLSQSVCLLWTWWRPITFCTWAPPHWSNNCNLTSWLFSPVFMSINKGCTEVMCLYSSQYENFTSGADMQVWQDTGVHRGLPLFQHCSQLLLPLFGPSARTKTHEHLLSSPEIGSLKALLLARGSLN